MDRIFFPTLHNIQALCFSILFIFLLFFNDSSLLASVHIFFQVHLLFMSFILKTLKHQSYQYSLAHSFIIEYDYN